MAIWNDKSVFITGGGSGIGKALSLALSRAGAHVCVTDVNGEAAAGVAAACGARATARTLDVRDAAAVRAGIEETAQAHGRLDYVFNNAGMGVGGETYELSVAHFDRVIDVNIRGVVHGVMAAYPIMVKQRSGHIINTASLAGLVPAPLLTAYSMSKHAVVGLSTSLRCEAAALGVRVSVLCPAAIETPILDSDNPADLPRPGWRPDLRRLLSRLSGAPYPVEKLAEKALAAIARDTAVIVIPGRAAALWRIAQLAPGLAAKSGRDAVAAERRSRG